MTDWELPFVVLRPWAFVFILPALLFVAFGLRGFKAWAGVIDPKLLRSLSTGVKTPFWTKAGRFAAGLACLCVVAAMAGVSFVGTKRALYEPKSPAVVVLDMSLSMRAADVSPNRFSRAVFKVYDLLNELKGVPTGFVVFTDEPYQLVPATTEKGVVESLLPLLNFSLMPSQGSRLDRAIGAAIETITESGAAFGDIFLITDGGDEVFATRAKTEALVKSAAKKGFRLFVSGVGTAAGGAVLQKENEPVLDALGNPVRHRLDDAWLRRLAAIGNGAYAAASADGTDVAFLSAHYRYEVGNKAFVFKRGRLLASALFLCVPAKADPCDWFLSPSMASSRQIGAGDVAAAVGTAERSKDFTALYNVGTRLIFSGDYAWAASVLEQAAALRPDDENAQINLEIARRLNKNPPRDSGGDGNGENDGGRDESDDGAGGGGESNGGGQGGGSEKDGDGDLNQSANNSPQDNENKENTDGNPNDFQDGSNDNSGDGQSEEGSDGGESGSPNGGADGGENGDGDMMPVHEDPAALLKHKILFQYYENRYGGEPEIGAKW